LVRGVASVLHDGSGNTATSASTYNNVHGNLMNTPARSCMDNEQRPNSKCRSSTLAVECFIPDTRGTSRSQQVARAICLGDCVSQDGAWVSATLITIKTSRMSSKSCVGTCLTSGCPIACLCALRIAWCITHRSPADSAVYARQTFAVAGNQIPQ
jgi:hypothetical protein